MQTRTLLLCRKVVVGCSDDSVAIACIDAASRKALEAAELLIRIVALHLTVREWDFEKSVEAMDTRAG